MAEEETYEVERIIGKGKDAEGGCVYLVKWKGYGEEEATWEPIANIIEQCEELVKAFEQAAKDAPPTASDDDYLEGLQYAGDTKRSKLADGQVGPPLVDASTDGERELIEKACQDIVNEAQKAQNAVNPLS